MYELHFLSSSDAGCDMAHDFNMAAALGDCACASEVATVKAAIMLMAYVSLISPSAQPLADRAASPSAGNGRLVPHGEEPPNRNRRTHMQAGYWFVQPYRVGGKVETEQPCTDCREVVAKVKTFRDTNTDPNARLRVHLPSHATDDERQQIRELGVESI
jgi:hypothetical protein